MALVVKNPPANEGAVGDRGSIPGWERPPGGGNGNPLKGPCLRGPMDRGDWRATVPGVANSQARLNQKEKRHEIQKILVSVIWRNTGSLVLGLASLKHHLTSLKRE